MKKFVLIGLIALVLFSGCVQTNSDAKPPFSGSEPPPIDQKPPLPTIGTILVTTDKTSYIVGETITITINNGLSNTVYYNRCNGVKVAGKGWWENCSEEPLRKSDVEKTIVVPRCPEDIDSADIPAAIATLEPGQTFTKNIQFTREEKLPICVQATFTYFSSCTGNICSNETTVVSDFVEISR